MKTSDEDNQIQPPSDLPAGTAAIVFHPNGSVVMFAPNAPDDAQVPQHVIDATAAYMYFQEHRDEVLQWWFQGIADTDEDEPPPEGGVTH